MYTYIYIYIYIYIILMREVCNVPPRSAAVHCLRSLTLPSSVVSLTTGLFYKWTLRVHCCLLPPACCLLPGAFCLLLPAPCSLLLSADCILPAAA
jgi:hypothetical protein